MKKANTILLLVLLVCSLAGSELWAAKKFRIEYGEKQISKSFDAKKTVRIKTVIGGCTIKRSPDDRIHVEVVHDFDPDEFEAKFQDSGGKLIIQEKVYDNDSGGDSHWIITVPSHTEVRYKSATGSLEVEKLSLELEVETGTGNITLEAIKGDLDLSTGTGDVYLLDCEGRLEVSSGTGNVEIQGLKGDMDANSGTGDVEIQESTGSFAASSGTGDVDVHGITVEGECDFNSGTGDVEVKLPRGTDFDLTVSSGTGSATLNFMGNPLRGYFEFSADARRGKIISPEKFDHEEEYYQGDDLYERKSFTKSGDDPHIYIKTGTGKARLKK
ncbi:MAG: DUF4097 family beta strand repeat protein [Candidatus Krumholzibacteriota bacterium]|nr:DUF4097 family beta strand repeat protein [Candidatus Krumholzibacteriota bacterium]